MVVVRKRGRGDAGQQECGKEFQAHGRFPPVESMGGRVTGRGVGSKLGGLPVHGGPFGINTDR